MATRLETSIGKRRHKRIKMVLPVKVSGRDAANNLIFLHLSRLCKDERALPGL